MSKRQWLRESSTSSSDDANEPVHKIRKSATSDSSSSRSNHESSSGDEKQATDYLSSKGQYSDFASRMLAKMGYKAGKGLGSKQQGIVEPVEASNQRGRRGLGLKIQAIEQDVVVDWESEKPPSAQEIVSWMPQCNEEIPDFEELKEWCVEGKVKLTIDDESSFCDEELLKTVLTCKTVFDDLEGSELRHARTRSNPYETIRGAIFLNRAAMKMANMDSVFDFTFTYPKDLPPNQLMYFADVCAGPGGFSEYFLWKRKWRAKGFGFTLKGKNDFKLEDFFAADSELFEPYYGVGGVNGDGDIMKNDNLEEFQRFVLENTDGKGVHFFMADGGFSVEGQENIQEILTKQLLLCQFACALSVLRMGGTFLCKTFDLFTPFSVSLVYVLRRAFENVTVFKPVTSRPANSERYVICKGYRDPERLFCEYLFHVNDVLNDFRGTDSDVTSVVPLDILMEDTDFCTYMTNSNESIATEQCKGLAKIHAYVKNRDLKEMTQAQVRRECLEKWQVPDKVRAAPAKMNMRECYDKYTEGMKNPLDILRNIVMLDHSNMSSLQRIFDYRCQICAGTRAIIVSLGGSRIYQWNYEVRRWVSPPDLRCLIPRNTILEVEFVQELKGEGKGQRKNLSIHIVDAIVLGGEDISRKHYTERVEDIKVFVAAISKPSLPNFNVVRAKQIFRSENIQDVFKCLSMRIVKGCGSEPQLCCQIEDSDHFFVPSGLCFMKITKDPWTMAFSKSSNRKYFFNIRTGKSSFDCPPDFCATYEMCASGRLYWSWERGVKVHGGQVHSRPNIPSREEVVEFISQHR